MPTTWAYWYPTTTNGTNGPREIASLPAVRRAVQSIAADLARCPVQVYRGRELIERHRASELLNGPDVDAILSSFHFRRWEAACALSSGNALSLIHPDESGIPERIEALPPGSVELKQERGRLRYMIDKTPVDPDLLLHQRWDVDPSQPFWGVSPVEGCLRALRTAAAREAQLETATADGMRGKPIFAHPGPLSPDARTKMRTKWLEEHGPNTPSSPGFVGEGMTASVLDENAVQRLLEARKESISNIALALDIPPQMLWEGEGRAAAEVAQLYVDSINRIAAGFAAEYTRKLCAPGERVVIPTYPLLSSDVNTAGRPIAQLVQVGVLSPNAALRRIGEMPSSEPEMDIAKPVISGVSAMQGSDNAQN